MKVRIIPLLLLAFSLPIQASEWTGNLNFLLGGKGLDENDWHPVEQQGEFGILVDFKRLDWPLSIAIDLLGAGEEAYTGSLKIEGSSSELDFGVRKIWTFADQPIRPYLGGGLGFMSGEYRIAALSDHDTALGVWLDGGVYWTIGKHFNLGLALRHSQAQVNLFNRDTEVGGSHAGLLLGYHW